MKISEILRPADVHTGVSVSSKAAVLKFVAETAASELSTDTGMILNALQTREELGSTGIGKGIAIPHASITGLVSPFALLVRLAGQIDFGSIDEEPVDIVCLILTPPGDQSRHLKTLSLFARQFSSPETVISIRTSADPSGIFDAIAHGGC